MLESELTHLVEEAEKIETVIKGVANCATECTEEHFKPYGHNKICYGMYPMCRHNSYN